MDEPVAKRTRGALADMANQQLAKEKATKLMVMSNRLLLISISESLSMTGLLGLRKTCHRWNSTFIPQLISRHSPIKLDFDLAEHEKKSVKNFIELMKSSTKMPFSNYELVNCRDNLLNFGSVVGHSVKKLSIKWVCDKYWMTSEVRRVIFEEMLQVTDLELSFSGTGTWEPTPKELEDFELFPATLSKSKYVLQLPNLKRFKFNFNGRPGAASQIVIEVVHYATELEEILLPCPRYDDYGYYTYKNFLDPVLGQMRNTNGNIHKLKHVEIGNVNSSILQTLLGMAGQKENALHLGTFSMSVTGEGWIPDFLGDNFPDHEEIDRHRSEMWEKIKSFLEKQAPTLRELSLWLPREDRHPHVISISLPQMERLHTLTITDPDHPIRFGEHRTPKLQLDGHTFESTFPGLKKLKYDIADNDEDEFRKVSHTGLIEIYLDAQIGQLLKLSVYFPSLTRLELYLRSDTIDMEKGEVYASIWNLWPGLTHLKLTIEIYSCDECELNPDKFLTGVPGGQLSALKAELDILITEHRPTFDELDVLARKYKTRFGIAVLNRLEEFQFEWCDLGERMEDWAYKLSDTAVYCGLALVGPQLRKITFVDEVADLLSEDCLKYIKTQHEFGDDIFPREVFTFK